MIKIKNEVVKTHPRFADNCLFHPTDAIEDPWGKRIIDAMANDKAIDTIRIYNMLEDIVYKNEAGELCYDFRLNDLRIDYLTEKGYNLMIAYAAVPECISRPVEGSSVSKNKTRYKGKMFNTSPPEDYGAWEEVCYQYTKHIVERYGIDVVSKWYLHCFNEPDIPAFFMKSEPWNEEGIKKRAAQYCKLYEAFERALCRVSDRLTIGGPALALENDFLEIFLNFVKEKNLKLDYIAMHNYGTEPQYVNSGEKPIRVSNILEKYNKHMAVIKKCGFENTSIIYDEWGACASGFFNIEECPGLIMRETEKLSAFYVRMIYELIRNDSLVSKMFICLSGQHEMTTDFSGFRNFFTLNFIRKPIYNAHILASKIGEEILKCETTNENVCVIPTKKDNGFAILLTYADDDLSENPEVISETVQIDGIDGKRATVYCIDKNHTNPYELFKKMGTEAPTPQQIELLRKEGTLSGETMLCKEDNIKLELTPNSVFLIEIS